MGFVADPAPAPVRGFVPDAPVGEADPDPAQMTPNMPAANQTFGRTLMNGFLGVAGMAARALKTIEPGSTSIDMPGSGTVKFSGNLHSADFGDVNAAAEATANTIVGLGAFPAALVGAPLSVARQWLAGDKDQESLGQAFDRINQGIAGPLYEESSPQGQAMTDKIGALINGVLLPVGLHMGVHPQLPEKAAAAFRELPPIVRDEMARKVTGQVIGSDDMQNVAKVVAGPDGTPASVKAAEASLRSVYDKTGIGPYTILEAAGKDPALKADLLDPAVDVPAALEQFVEKPAEPEVPVPGDGKPLETKPDAPQLSFDSFRPEDVIPPELMARANALLAEHPKADRPSLLTDEQAATAQKELAPSVADAIEAKPAFDQKLIGLAKDIGATGYMLADVKGGARLLEKHVLENDSDTANMRDLVRGSIVVDSVKDVPAALAAIKENFELTRLEKDRFAKPTPSGYSDVLINVRLPNGGEGEIQIHTPEMIAAKKIGHKVYDIERDMGENPADTAKQARLRGLQREIYAAALKAGEDRKLASNSSLETGEPYAKTLAEGNGRSTPAELTATQDSSGSRATEIPSTSKNFEPAGNEGTFISTSKPIVRPDDIHADVLEKHGLDDTPETRAQLASVAQAAGIDEAAVRAAAVLHADDEPAFHQAIQEIIDGEAARQAEQQQGASDGGGGTGAGGQDPGAEPGATGDSGAATLGPGTLRTGIGPSDVVSAVRGIVKGAKDVTNGVIDSKAGQEVTGALFPMSKGGDIKAKAEAQRFANAMRLARFQWQRMADFIRDNFTADERRAMWDAADEENVLRTQGIDTTGKGLDRLTPKQRDAVEHLHELSQGLWKRAQDAGMVEGEGLPFWTPRMAVRIGEDGDFLKPGGEGQTATSKGEGGNVKTSTPNTKQRKYTLADETEAAMKARLGDNTELVRDIGTMPLAMARMAQAIAGRELVNQLKEYGLATGEPVISETGGPGFTTIDHPAFTTYRPDFITDADGKTVPRTDQNGDVVMTRNPMHISDEWAGPLKAVLSKTDGAIYRAYMLMKSKAMTAIMISPAAHNMVIWGRAMAYDPAAVGTLRAYFSGHALANDPGLMNQAISDGMVPMGANKSAMMDVTDVARGIGKEGGWGDPNESWINLAVQKAVNVFSEEAGTKVKAAMDAFGDFWHHTLLWKQVGALQTYIYNDYRNLLLEKGHPPEVAGPIAAHLANRYAGAVAAENSSEMLRKALNVMLFSRSFNVGNIGAVHDTAFGLPAGLRAKMMVDAGEGPAAAGIDAAKAKARKGIVADVGISMLLTAVTSAAVAKLLLNQTPQDIADGYTRRLAAMLGNIQDHPLNPTSYNPYRVLPTWDNEEGKQDRIDLGAQPGGRHEYLRLPTGKVVEDTVGWLLHAPDTFGKKLSPTVKAAWQSVTNDKGFGVPVEDPSGSTLKHIAQGMEHVIAAQVPMDQLKTLADVTEGHGTEIDKTKLAGAASGFTVSQGNPRGPEEAAFYAQQDRVKAEKAYAMEGVRDDIKKGDDAAAFERLRAIGIPPREIAMTINNIKNPRQGMSKQQTRRFVAEGNDADRASMENARRQTGPSIQTE